MGTRLFAVLAVVLFATTQLQAVTVSANINGDLTDLSGSGEEGLYPVVGMYSYDDADPIVGNRRDLTGFMWNGPDINFDLATLNAASINNAEAVFDGGGNFLGLDVDINDAIASADALKLNPDGSIAFWSSSEGPFGEGFYESAPKDGSELFAYNINADLTDFDTGAEAGLYEGIGMFSYDVNHQINGKAPLLSFMWDGPDIVFDLAALDPASVNQAYALLDGSNNLIGIRVDINDSIASADALSLLTNGDIEFWSSSEGPFGAGTYTFERKAIVVPNAVPEPASLSLAMLGLAALTFRRGKAA